MRKSGKHIAQGQVEAARWTESSLDGWMNVVDCERLWIQKKGSLKNSAGIATKPSGDDNVCNKQRRY